MNYPQSLEILEKIKSSQKIMLVCHRNPDADAIGSILSLYQIIFKMGIKVEMFCTDEVPSELKFLLNSELVNVDDYSDVNFSSYDTIVIVDSDSKTRAFKKEINFTSNFVINIDHHSTNVINGNINIVDTKSASCCEIILGVFDDWGVKIDADTANCLFAGLLTDTGILKFPSATINTFEHATELLKLGAQKDLLIQNIFNHKDFKTIKLVGEMLTKTELNEAGKFVYCLVSQEMIKNYGMPEGAKDIYTSNFGSIVKGTNFSILIFEMEKDIIRVNLRSNGKINIANLAKIFGGGGHPAAAGAEIRGMDFSDGVSYILKVAEKYAQENPAGN